MIKKDTQINCINYIKNTTDLKYVYSTAELVEDSIVGSLYSSLKGQNKLKDGSDFDNIELVQLGEYQYTIYTTYKNATRSLYIIKACDEKIISQKTLITSQKIDNIYVQEKDNDLYLIMESFSGDYVDLRCMILSSENLDVLKDFIVTNNERAYKPKFCIGNDTIYLVYEAFYNEHYHILLRVLSSGNKNFSKAIEVGCSSLNDQAPSIIYHDGNVYVTWENSSSLYDDYVWQPPNPELSTVYMPGFGHGWRVFTTMHFRKLHVDSDKVELFAFDDGEINTKMNINTEEASGENIIFIHNNTLFVMYVEYAGHNRYRLKLCYYKDGIYVDVPIANNELYERKNIAYKVCDGMLHIANNNLENEIIMLTVDLSDCFGSIPCTKKVDTYRFITLTNSVSYQPPKIKAVTIDDEEYSLFWGDLHMHSNTSMCSRHDKFHCSYVMDKNRFSRDVGKLDFCMLTDHQTMSDHEWALTKKAADFSNVEGFYTAYLGFEWTSTQNKELHNYGHYNVLYKDTGKLYRIHDRSYDNLEKMWADLDYNSSVTIPHHPSDSVHAMDWNYFNENFVPLVEIYQVRGSYEYDYCEFNPIDYGRDITPNNSIQYGLNKGYHFGFTSGGEHEGVGLTGIFSKDLTRESVFEAIKARRVYGTTSMKIYLSYFANDVFMGGEVYTNSNEFNIKGKIESTSEIDYIKLITNQGELDMTACYNHKTQNYAITTTLNDVTWAYVRVKQVDGNIAWSSPVFFNALEECIW